MHQGALLLPEHQQDTIPAGQEDNSNACSCLCNITAGQWECSVDSLKICYLRYVQRVQNAAARLVCLTGRWEHITPTLQVLHWLPIRQRISFKEIVLTYQALHGTAYQYMADLHPWYQPTRSLRSSDALISLPHKVASAALVTGHLSMQPPDCGMECRLAFVVRTILTVLKKSSEDISLQGCLQRVMCFTDTMDSIFA